MTVQMWFVDDDVAVVPGATTVLQLIVVNDGEDTETIRLAVSGIAAPWTTLHPSVITVLPGSQEQVAVEVLPPRLPTTAAGSTVMSVRATAEGRADVAAETTIALAVTGVHDRRLTLLQPAQRGRSAATFEMTLENRGNTHTTSRMRLLDPSGRVEAEFDPPAVGVDPGATALVRARVRATQRQWERRSRTLTFRVEADQPGGATVAAPGTLVQLPMLPERLLGRTVAALLVAVALVAAWFGLVRPAIRDAAADAVRDRLATTAGTTTTTPTVSGSSVPTTATTPGDGSPSTTVAVSSTVPPASTTPPSEVGTAFAQRLSVDVAPGQTQATNYVVPTGTVLRVTDVVLQNPNSDSGTATLSRGDQVLLTFGLGPLFYVPSAFVTPIEVPAGEQLVFTLSCAAVGAGAGPSGTCSAAVLVSGRTVPAP